MSGYFRAFVALTEEQPGYSVLGKSVFGKAIIEARGAEGKLLVSVQGLKPNVFYKIYLVAKNINVPNSRFSGVFMGNLAVNDKGACDIKMPFNAHNVGESGFKVEQFSTVAIIVHNAPTLTVPLVGHVGEPVIWKNGFEVFKKTELEHESLENTITAEAVVETVVADPVIENVAEEAPVEVVEAEPDLLKNEPNNHEKFKDYVQAYNADTSEPAIAPEMEDEPIIEAVLEVVEEPKITPPIEPVAEQAAAEVFSFANTADALDELFRHNAKMSPFVRPDHNIEWVRVAPEHAALIGLFEIAESDFAAQAFQRYKHLVLGRVPGSRYILGIPDIYNLQTAATLESKGFGFKRCDGGDATEGSYGYWIIVV